MNNEYIIIPIIAIVVGIIAFVNYYFSKKNVIKRKLKKATGKKISEFLNGEIAKVVGKVDCLNKPIIAPLSGRPCAYYYVLVEQKVSSGKSSHWKKLIEEEIAGAFVIKDGRYCARIDTKNIKSYITEDRKYTSGFLEDATEVLEKYLNDHGQKSEGILGFNRTLRYKEGVLEQGELIAVIGRGEWKHVNQDQMTSSFGKVLEISSTEEEAVYLSDDPETVRITYA